MEFTFTVTEEELMVIGNGLAELPFKISSLVIGKLQNQVNAQNEKKDEVIDNE